MFKVVLCVAMEHDWRLVGLAAAVCLASALATFFLYSKAPALPASRRWIWLGLTGLVAGSGIWTTHFVAMLAFKTGLPTGYAVVPTFGSLLVAIASTTVGFAVGSARVERVRRETASIAGGLIVGLGITLMHYIGMSGYRTMGQIHWSAAYVAASVAIGAVLAAAALAAAPPGSPRPRRLAGGGLLALAIVGMHFTGMTAVTIVPDSRIRPPLTLLSDPAMIGIAVVVTAIILITAIGGAAFDGARRNGSLRRLREALDVMPEGLAFYDASDRLMAWNFHYEGLCRALGATPYAGMPFTDLMLATLATGAYPDAVGRERAWLAERKAARRGELGSMTQPLADGRWLRITDRRAPDGGVVTATVDITELKRAELAIAQSEERFRRIAVNAPDMITESGMDGVLTYVSPASLAITGFSPEELIGKPFASVMEPEDAEKISQMCRAVLRSRGRVAPWPVEFRARHKSGAELWLESKPTPTIDPVSGRFNGLTDVVRDITPRKALEAQLRLARAEAEAAAAVKAEFLANMSHELRTPLTSIIGFTGLAAEQPDLSDLTRAYVERVADASRALLCTVNDILDFSKLEAGQVAIHAQPVDLTRLCRATLELFAPQAAAKDLDLVLDIQDEGPLTVSVDPDRIRQILLNFVSNAVKFTAAGQVTLSARYDRAGAALTVEVFDTGGGVPAELQDRLFKRFSQIDGSLSRAQGGTGLGLAICKGLVEAMGGEIGMDSEPGHGSRFWFRIPAAEAIVAGDDDAGEASLPIYPGLRVLVVDDHPANRQLAGLFLAGIGAEVTEAADGQEAVLAAKAQAFDVILMDVRMPRLDGPGALARIRAEPGPNAATPILAFTADATLDAADRLLALGFQDVVGKPIDPAALIGALGRARAAPEAQAAPWAIAV